MKCRKWFFVLLTLFTIIVCLLFWQIRFAQEGVPDFLDVYTNLSLVEYKWEATASKWANCSLSECIAVERCLLHPKRRLSIYVQPILRAFDKLCKPIKHGASNLQFQNGKPFGCTNNNEPSNEFLEIRRIIRQSANFESDPSLSCLVLPGIDFTQLTECSPKRFFALSGISRSVLPDNSNFVFVNLKIADDFLTVRAPFPGIFVSGQHSRHSLRAGLDLAIPLPLPKFVSPTPFSILRRPIHILIILPFFNDRMRAEIVNTFSKKTQQPFKLVQKCATGKPNWKSLGTFCEFSRELSLPSLETLIAMSNVTLIPDGNFLPQSLVWLALRFGSVPALVSDNFVPPFSDSIDWHKFSFLFAPSLLRELPRILISIPMAQLDKMRSEGVRSFSSHFSSLQRIVASAIASLEARIIPGKSDRKID